VGNDERAQNLLRGREALAKPPARQKVAHAQRLKTVRGFFSVKFDQANRCPVSGKPLYFYCS